ncbi:MAG: DNA gyrase subunit A [Bacillota bacterium]|nr:DNA gyrase subunit A [Bacillota bacterium]MDD3297734.1 DNA gyrase subunit A [Bacillota bacterium]MDD3850070.1 DNA gyrase subunit A [Bacillota bacterium]MDD4706693.1 DNA gyrase subunit A [Bacillota bacterium]
MTEVKDNIVTVDIQQEMKKSYIDYAMSVIVSRALPDVRDGLKPVHRRILYAMNELGLAPDKPHRKSARIVGDVLGKYHPHGDSAVYDAMVRLAQDFSTRQLLVDGHGNFGSVDGDSAAAMRYTEARMAKIALEMLKDINKDTVDFIPNFDESMKEPAVLPSRFPNILVNGASGIAVGMATSIPPHNLGEVIDGVVMLIENPDIGLKELTKVIKGPDFPTGATILGKNAIKEAYATGRGKVTVRAKASIEASSANRHRIIVTEIPYQVNKSKLIERIAGLVRDKKIEGISDIRDETDRKGMRIVIELKRDVNPQVVQNLLYKHTQLQDTFSIIMLALVDGQPRVMSLKEILEHYLAHQKDVVRRRTIYDLNRAEERAHILEGLRIALDNIDRVITLIRSSKNDQIAKDGLMSEFGLSEKQAQAILDMRLRRLTGLEREKIDSEYKDLLEKIRYFKDVLEKDELLASIIKEEMLEIKAKFSDSRRTNIVPDPGEFNIEDLIEEQEVAITLTHFGYIKRIPAETYRSQRRGGRGVTALTTKTEDFVSDIFTTSTHNYILFFTNRGRVYRLKAYEIPEAGRHARGTAIVNLLQLSGSETITAVIPVEGIEEERFMMFATRRGMVKKTSLSEYISHRKSGLQAIALVDGDELIGVKLTTGRDHVLMATKKGYSIRFREEDVRSMGRNTRGVKGITLSGGDEVVGMELVREGADLLIVTVKGFGKRTDLREYGPQKRGGKGLKTYKITRKTKDIVGIKVVDEQDDIMLITKKGVVIRLNVNDISRMGRITQGVTLMKFDKDQTVVSIARTEKDEN